MLSKFGKSRQGAFTLVEMAIAVVLSTIISIFLMSLMTRFQQTAVELSGRTKAARDAIMVMYTLKNMIRKAESVTPGVNAFSIKTSDGQFDATFEPDSQAIRLSDSSKVLGVGSIMEFELKSLQSKLDVNTNRVYQIIIKIRNPEAPYKDQPQKALEKALVFTTIVSQRVPLKMEEDPNWVKNVMEQCPPNCSTSNN